MNSTSTYTDLFGNPVRESNLSLKEPVKKAEARDNRPFKLTDSLFLLDKRSTWLEYRRLINEGYTADELLSVIWWAFKSILQVSRGQAGVHAFVASKIRPLLTKITQEHLTDWILDFFESVVIMRTRPGVQSESELERWILSMPEAS